MDRAEPLLQVEVVFSPAPRQVECVRLQLPAGATVADAVRASGLLQRHPQIDPATLACSVWGRVQPADHVLRARDRVELCRVLTVDPKEARRQRYRGQGGRKVAKNTRSG